MFLYEFSNLKSKAKTVFLLFTHTIFSNDIYDGRDLLLLQFNYYFFSSVIFHIFVILTAILYIRMKFSTLIKHATELNRIILKSPTPADTLATEYLRAKKYIGSNERKIISEIVFNKLRIESLARNACENFLQNKKLTLPNDSMELLAMPASIAIAHFLPNNRSEYLQMRLEKITDIGESILETLKDAVADLAIIPGYAAEFVDFCTEYAEIFLCNVDSDTLLSPEQICLQPIIVESLQKRYSARTINEIALSALASAPVCLRVNTLKNNRDNILEILDNCGIKATKSELSPDGIILFGRPNLSQIEIFQNGDVEVQDIGSQIIGYALGVEPDSAILDACAGAGGKTLHLAALSQDRAKIIATDIEFKRLKEIRKRAEKAGIASIETVIQKTMNLKEQVKRKFDYILIDAPCSGTGTIRRMPMPKWRLNEKLLSKINAMQTEILDYYSEFLEPGGKLVYATCSLLPDENGEIIDAFLASHPNFRPEPILPTLSNAGVNTAKLGLSGSDYMLYLTPLNGETDGFFLSCITKTEE